MIDLNFINILKGIQLKVNMICVCSNQRETDQIYRNAVDIFFPSPDFKKKDTQLEILYNFHENYKGNTIRFKNLTIYDNYDYNSCRGFIGIFLIHPNIINKSNMSYHSQDQLLQMKHYKQR